MHHWTIHECQLQGSQWCILLAHTLSSSQRLLPPFEVGYENHLTFTTLALIKLFFLKKTISSEKIFKYVKDLYGNLVFL